MSGWLARRCCRSIQQTSDGNYITAGFTYSSDGDVAGNTRGGEFFIAKLSQTLPLNSSVTYVRNGANGAAPTDSKAYLSGNTVTVLGKSTLTWAGYKFAGWSKASYGAGMIYAPGSTFTIGKSSVVLYARGSN